MKAHNVQCNNNNNNNNNNNKSPEDRRRVAVTQTPVKNHQFALRWKTLKSVNFAGELKKTIKCKSDGDSNSNLCTRYSHQRIGTGTGRLQNKRSSVDSPNYRIVEIGQNNEKSPGDWRTLAVTQTPVKNSSANADVRNSRFKRLINNISHDKTWTCLRIANFKRETESLLIAAQDNAIRTNHIKARIDKTQQNSKWRLCGDRDETINHIISECSKLAQREYKARHDWVGKVIHWKMCKKFKFDHTNKWYMHNPAPVLENATHKLLWDFNILTDHLIPARRPDLIIINKKKKRTCKIVDFAVSADHRIKLKECEKKDKYLDLARELKKLWNMQVIFIPIVIGKFGTVTKGLLKGLEDLEVGGRVETIQTTALLRTARILRRVLETWGDLLSLRLQ